MFVLFIVHANKIPSKELNLSINKKGESKMIGNKGFNPFWVAYKNLEPKKNSKVELSL